MDVDAQVSERFGIGRLFTLTHEAVIGADLRDEVIVLWNPSAERLFGYTAEEAVGMPLDAVVPEELRGAHRTGFRRFRDTGEKTLIGGPPVEVPAVTKDGARLWIALTVTDVTADDGSTSVVAVIRDVTAQKAAEAALVRSHEAMRDFVATASHDLRTPLTGVLGYARSLQHHGARLSDAQRAAHVDAIIRSGERAARMVDDLLTVSKIEAQIVETRRELVDVAAAVEDAASSTGVDAEVDVEAGLQVVADADHVQRILTNLLSNARKYGRPPVRVRATRSGTAAEIQVSDAGEGVPAEFRDALFERFTRHPGHRDVDGTGLGLAIVQGLAHANGGAAAYRHDGGRWCFAVRLPAVGG
jgi:PAS domain S-box-containing protein